MPYDGVDTVRPNQEVIRAMIDMMEARKLERRARKRELDILFETPEETMVRMARSYLRKLKP